MMNIKELVNRRARLQAKGVYAVRDIVVLRGLSIGEAIRNMDYDKFHLVYVIDDEFGHMATFTEQEIMDAVLGHDSDMTFDQLIMMKKEEKEGVSSGSGGIF